MTGRRPALFPQKNPPFHGTASRWGRWDAAGCCLGEYVGPTPDHGSLYWPRCDLMLSASGCGHLALRAQEHVFPDGGDPFFEEIQEVYDEIGEGLPPDAVRARPGELEDDRAGIEASGLFEVTGIRQYDWERVYGAEEYIDLLSTFSNRLTMANWQRERLYGEIRRRLAERPGRSVRRGWGAVLHVARRRERPLRGGAGGRAWGGALDLAEELGVGAGLVGLVEQELKGLLGVEGTEGPAELSGGAVFVGLHQQLVAAG